MTININGIEPSNIKIGTTSVSEVYIGSTKVRPSSIPVTGVSLDKSSITLNTVGQTEQLTATVIPNNATDQNVTWSSSDTSIATVDSTGLVTCVTPGTATITVTTDDGGFTATCGVVSGWTPGANTLFYLPLNSTYTYTDQSDNHVSTTNTGVTFGIYQGVDCGYFNYAHIQVTPFDIPNSCTMLCWCYCVNAPGGDGKVFDARNYSAGMLGGFENYGGGYFLWTANGSINSNQSLKNEWVLFAITVTNQDFAVYVKGASTDSTTTNSYSFSGFTPVNINIGNEWNNGASRYFIGGMSNLIVEDKVWTATEISNYYDQTKGDYGIS